MSKFMLIAQSPLNDFSYQNNGINVTECSHYALVSIATPQNHDEKLSQVIEKSFKVRLPEIGYSSFSKTNNCYLLGLQSDQYFVLLENQTENAVEKMTLKTEGFAYLCDQSDSWVMLKLSGNNTRQALEHICPLDLHTDAFPVGAVARTLMEHLAVIIFHQAENSYFLLSPRSSSESFIDAVLTST